MAYSIAFNTHAFSQNLPDANAFSNNDNLGKYLPIWLERFNCHKIQVICPINRREFCNSNSGNQSKLKFYKKCVWE